MGEPIRCESASDLDEPKAALARDALPPVDDMPLGGGPVDGSLKTERPSSDLLLISLKFGYGSCLPLVAVALAIAGILPIAGAIAEAVWWLGLLLGLVCVLPIAVLLVYVIFVACRGYSRRIRLDRREGRLFLERRTGLRGRFRAEQSYPLDAIREIQLLYQGMYFEQVVVRDGGNSPGGSSSPSDWIEYPGYELNLVLHDPHTARANLLVVKCRSIREAAEAMAEFLGVPVIDRLGGNRRPSCAPVLLRLEDRTIDVPATAMAPSAGWRSGDIGVRIVADGAEGLTVTPTSRVSGWVTLCLLVLAAVVGCMWWEATDALLAGALGGAIFLLVISAPIAGLFVGGLYYGLLRNGPRRFRFDRRHGQLLVERWHTGSWQYRTEAAWPLAKVVAVQLLFAGRDPNYCRPGYEMDLILDDPQSPRLHVCSHGNWRWFRQEGRRVADFLAVPLIDQLATEGAGA